MHTELRETRDGLRHLVDSYQAKGRYVFTREQAQGELAISREALKKAARRLVLKNRLAVPRQGFFVIVPLEYRAAGAPPPSWFVPDLMKFLGVPYYVGLLTAAALHGAGHQQPQEFQVITTKQIRPVVAGRARIQFFVNRYLDYTPIIEVNTETGSMRVSSPEATALDLLRYVRAAGYLGNVATVLSELAEEIDPRRLLDVAKLESQLPHAQRLGYLLDRIGVNDVAAPLAQWIAQEQPRVVPLRPGRPLNKAVKDSRWRLFVNETVEVDT